jgi:hypothetical protein
MQQAPARRTKKRKARVEVLQWLLEQGNLLGSTLAFLPTADALQGLGLASRAWHEAVNGALPHVTIKGQLPAGASLADRFPSLTSLHIKRLPAGDLPALLAGGLPHRLVRLTLFPREDWGFRCKPQLLAMALGDAFPEVFFASEWPQLEHLGLGKWPHRFDLFLDEARAHPSALTRLQSLGVISGEAFASVARAIQAGLLPGLRRVETDGKLRGGLRHWRTVLEHARDTPALRVEELLGWRSTLTLDHDDSGADSDADQADGRVRLAQLFASGVTSRMR